MEVCALRIDFILLSILFVIIGMYVHLYNILAIFFTKFYKNITTIIAAERL